MSPPLPTAPSASAHRWLFLLAAGGALEAAALWLAATSSWYAPLIAHLAAVGTTAEAVASRAPGSERTGAARAVWVAGVAVPFATVAIGFLVAWAVRRDTRAGAGHSAEDERRNQAAGAAAARARRRTVPKGALSVRDALEAADSQTRLAAIETLRDRRGDRSMKERAEDRVEDRVEARVHTLVAALDNASFEVRTQAAQQLEEVGASYSRRLAALRRACAPDICRPEVRFELIDLLLAYARLALHTDEGRRAVAREAVAQARKLPRAHGGGKETELLLRSLLLAGEVRDAERAAASLDRRTPLSAPLRRALADLRFALRDVEGARALLESGAQRTGAARAVSHTS